MGAMGKSRTILIGLWLFWTALLLGFYYRQIGLLVAGDSETRQLLRQDLIASPWVLTVWALWIVFGVALGFGLWRHQRKSDIEQEGRKAENLKSVCLIAGLAGLGAVLVLLLLFSAVDSPSLWKYPAQREAAARALRAVAGAGLVLWAAFGLGGWVCRLLRFQPGNRNQRLLFRLSAGLLAQAYMMMVLAFLGLYRPEVVRWVVPALALGSGAISLKSKSRRQASRSTAQKELIPSEREAEDAPGAHPTPPVKRPGETAICLSVIGLAMSIALVGALAPEVEYDALWYHLWLPKLWLAHGGLVDVVEEYISLYPMGTELLFGAAMTLGGPGAAKLVHFAFLPLTALLVWEFARRFARRASPWVAVAIFVTIPTVLWEASTAYVDLALALPIGLAIYSALEYAATRRRAWFVLASLNLGFALMIKNLALLALVLISGGLALRLWFEERNMRRALMPAAGLAFFSLLIPLPCYLRNLLASGNPFFPDLYGFFGAFPAERWDALSEHALGLFKTHFGRPRTLLNLVTLPWDLTVHGHRYGGTFGPLLALFLPGLLFPRLRKTAAVQAGRRILPWLAGFVLLFTYLWASPLSSFQLRFLIATAPILAVLAAAGFSRLQALAEGRLLRWVLPSLLAGLLLLNLPPFTALHEADRVGWDGWLTHVMRRPPLDVVVGKETQADYLKRTVRSYAVWQYINVNLPEKARILTFSGGDHLYSDRSRLWSDSTLARPAVWGALAGQETQAFAALRRLEMTHILFDKRLAERTGQLAIRQPQAVDGRYALEYEDGGFVLYRILWE